MGFYHAKPLFELGKICATPGAAALEIDLGQLLHRHHCGDWGEELGEDDRQANEAALRKGKRILSCYMVSGVRLYIITEWNRSVTTVMLADEY